MNFFMVDAPLSVHISPEEYKVFYAMDRELYAVLINDLWRDPVESMRIMALWLWLERSGFNGIVKKILSFPSVLINELADEALISLKYLDKNKINDAETTPVTVRVPAEDNFPLTQNFVDSKISARFFHKNRLLAIPGISKMISNVCVKALTDIMDQAMERNLLQYMSLMRVSPPVLPMAAATAGFEFDPPGREIGLHPDERTMFVTFSKGYPVNEMEIRDFFAKFFGDRIESLFMQEVLPGEQSLFARIVFYSPDSIPLILNGAEKVKFSINGKHVWMRKYVAKRQQQQKSLASPSSPPLLSSPNISQSLFARHFV
ncbi:uncharacterized protein LOC124911225 [Impatiens glandulifera]|uniref:uncharacterized protein LOC124911225 n=1 Tax=Impatiens glandulifera TaxID=253017 RepID=UPI001FB0EFA9|nr:uncharacterized protein LOC124911225 [Impatiens glandulifera]